MSDPRLEALSETARNRGLRLIRSRIRTAGKRGYGLAGLVDGSGRSVFGMEGKNPAATPDAIETFLRGLEANDWDASLGAATARSPANLKSARVPAAVHQDERSELPRAMRPSKPQLPPKPVIRKALPSDAARLAELIRELGHPIDASEVRKNLAELRKSGETPLVAALGGEIVGMCGIGRRVVIARPAPIGRISSLIVTKDAQGHGLGRMLVEAAEAWMRSEGCKLVEVTSNDRRGEAHAFYRHMGYERTSIRFAKSL